MENKDLKSFWKRPEGVTGKIFMGALIAGGGFLLYKALPFLITFMQNMYYAIGLFAGLALIVTVLSDKRFRTTMWYMYKSAMRFFTGMFIQLNPIAILESYVQDLKEKIAKIEGQLINLKGQIGKINQKIETKTSDIDEAYAKSRAAEKRNMTGEKVLYVTQAERLSSYLEKLILLRNKMDTIYKVLDKMKYYSGIMAQNTEWEVQAKKDERELITKSYSIMKTAYDVINGDGDKKEMFDQAMGFVVDDIGFKVGEMERMLDTTTEFINSVDLENAVYEERGLKFLEEVDQKGIEAVFGNRKTLAQGNTNFMEMKNIGKDKGYELIDKKEDANKKNKYFN